MITVEINDLEFNSKSDACYTLRKIAEYIEDGYTSGITDYGVCWSIEGKDEEEE